MKAKFESGACVVVSIIAYILLNFISFTLVRCNKKDDFRRNYNTRQMHMIQFTGKNDKSN